MPKRSIVFTEEQFELITKHALHEGVSYAEMTRILLDRGLSDSMLEKNKEEVAELVRESMEIVIKPHIERLASLTSKTGHMASRATFFNINVMQSLFPKKNRAMRELYDKASKMAVEYMRN